MVGAKDQCFGSSYGDSNNQMNYNNDNMNDDYCHSSTTAFTPTTTPGTTGSSSFNGEEVYHKCQKCNTLYETPEQLANHLDIYEYEMENLLIELGKLVTHFPRTHRFVCPRRCTTKQFYRLQDFQYHYNKHLECKHDCPGKPAGCTVKFNRFSELTTHVCTQTKFNEEYGEKLRALKDWATERSRYEVKIVLEEHRAQMLAKAKDYLSNTEVLRLIVKLLYPTAPFDLTTKVRNMLPESIPASDSAQAIEQVEKIFEAIPEDEKVGVERTMAIDLDHRQGTIVPDVPEDSLGTTTEPGNFMFEKRLEASASRASPRQILPRGGAKGKSKGSATRGAQAASSSTVALQVEPRPKPQAKPARVRQPKGKAKAKADASINSNYRVNKPKGGAKSAAVTTAERVGPLLSPSTQSVGLGENESFSTMDTDAFSESSEDVSIKREHSLSTSPYEPSLFHVFDSSSKSETIPLGSNGMDRNVQVYKVEMSDDDTEWAEESEDGSSTLSSPVLAAHQHPHQPVQQQPVHQQPVPQQHAQEQHTQQQHAQQQHSQEQHTQQQQIQRQHIQQQHIQQQHIQQQHIQQQQVQQQYAQQQHAQQQHAQQQRAQQQHIQQQHVPVNNQALYHAANTGPDTMSQNGWHLTGPTTVQGQSLSEEAAQAAYDDIAATQRRLIRNPSYGGRVPSAYMPLSPSAAMSALAVREQHLPGGMPYVGGSTAPSPPPAPLAPRQHHQIVEHGHLAMGPILSGEMVYVHTAPPRLHSEEQHLMYEGVVYSPVEPHSPNGQPQMGPQLDMAMYPDSRLTFDPHAAAARGATIHPPSPIHEGEVAPFSYTPTVAGAQQTMHQMGHPMGGHHLADYNGSHVPSGVHRWLTAHATTEEGYILLSNDSGQEPHI